MSFEKLKPAVSAFNAPASHREKIGKEGYCLGFEWNLSRKFLSL